MRAAVVGSFVVDLMARTPHLPEPGETVKGSMFQIGAGGKGLNQAVAAHKAGCALVFSTKLGSDNFAQIALDALEQEGMGTEYVFHTSDAPTATALIAVDEHTSQNSIVVVLGACDTFDDTDIDRLDAALEGCEYLLLQLEINPDAVEKLVRLAAKKGIRVILNPAPVQEIAPCVYQSLYLITPNEVEARILTGIPCETQADCRSVAQAFFKKGVRNVVLTLGGKGAYVNDGSRERFLPCYEMDIVDTTGAGDAFNGGLLAGLSRGMDIMDAAALASVVANLSVTRLGTSCAMPSASEIAEFIEQNGIRFGEESGRL